MKTFLYALRVVSAFSLNEKKLIHFRGLPEAPSSGALDSVPGKKEAPKKKMEKAEKRENLTKKSVYERAQFKIRMDRVKEAKEKSEKILFTYEYPLAESTVPDSVRADELPPLRKDFEYRAIGGVDATSFDSHKPRDQKWFEDKCQFANTFAQLFTNQQIVSNFSVLSSLKSQHRVLELVNELALVDNKIKTERFDAVEFKKRLDSKYTKEELYGPQGIFNLMLAMKRAHEAIRGKDAGVVQYDLRVGQGRLSEAGRFTQLREMSKKPVEIPLLNTTPHADDAEEAAASQRTKETLSAAGVSAESVVRSATEEYTKTYKFPVVVRKSMDGSGNPVLTMTLDLGAGAKKNVYLRAYKDVHGIRYSLSPVANQNAITFDTLKDAEQAFRVQAEKILSKAAERVHEGVKVQLDSFFENEKYLRTLDADVDSRKVTGIQRVGGERGIDFSDAQYEVLMKNHDTVYVYTDLKNKTVSLRISKYVRDGAQDGLRSISIGDISFDDLSSQGSKDALAVRILDTIRKTKT